MVDWFYFVLYFFTATINLPRKFDVLVESGIVFRCYCGITGGFYMSFCFQKGLILFFIFSPFSCSCPGEIINPTHQFPPCCYHSSASLGLGAYSFFNHMTESISSLHLTSFCLGDEKQLIADINLNSLIKWIMSGFFRSPDWTEIFHLGCNWMTPGKIRNVNGQWLAYPVHVSFSCCKSLSQRELAVFSVIVHDMRVRVEEFHYYCLHFYLKR